MKNLIPMAAVMLVACDGGCVPPPSPSKVTPVLRERPDTTAIPSVARLMHDENGRLRFHCTAWKLDDALVVTAGHCCDEGETYYLSGQNVIDEKEEARIVVDLGGDATDPARDDVCVMTGRLRGPSPTFAVEDPPLGAHIWTVGYPRGTFLISEGIWSGRDPNDGLGVCSSVLNPGASGSPVLNSESQVIGVDVKYWPGMDSLSFVVPIERLREAVGMAWTRAVKR